MFAVNLKSSNTKEKCQKWHLTFELKFEMSQNKLRCQWHLKLFLKCHGQEFRCHKCHKCHKKKRLKSFHSKSVLSQTPNQGRLQILNIPDHRPYFEFLPTLPRRIYRSQQQNYKFDMAIKYESANAKLLNIILSSCSITMSVSGWTSPRQY